MLRIIMSDATENAWHFPSIRRKSRWLFLGTYGVLRTPQYVRNAKHSVVANDYTRNIRERRERIYEESPKAIPKYRRRRFRSSNKNAQASAIGAMLAFMMLLLVLSMVMLYYMPAWMEEKEFSHMRSVEKGFMDITSTISSSVLRDDKTTETKIPIQLGTEGIPLIVTGTLGTLAVTPYSSTLSIYNSTKALNITSMGCIKFTSQNRYYITQNFIYESGAMFVEQTENTTMKIEPEFNITNNKITLTFITIVGSNTTITGFGTQAVRLKMDFCETATYTWSSENITINITSEYSSAWKSFFERKLKAQTGINISSGNGYTTVILQNIKELELKFVAVSASISAP